MSLGLQDLSAVATAFGAVMAGWQLLLVQRHSVTQFEDQLSAQYRAIMRELPIDALLGKEISAEELRRLLPVFFHYFDLCNEQAFLNERKRVRRQTWNEWKEGIRQNLRRPAFGKAWSMIAESAPDSFDELRRICPPNTESPASRLVK